MRKKTLSILMLGVGLLVVRPSFAATFYVAKTGSDFNSCGQAQSQSTPRLTVRTGAECLTPGDTLYIKSGIYSERANSIKLPPGASWKNATTISNFAADVVI